MEINKKWTREQIMRFEKFHAIAKRRLALGESEESVYADAPEGYSEWVKLRFKDHGGVRLPKQENIPKTICWNCKREYIGERCPYPDCGAFKPRKDMIR